MGCCAGNSLRGALGFPGIRVGRSFHAGGRASRRAHAGPAAGQADYDIAILGGGLAGLSLAVRLAAPRFAGFRVLVVEPRTEYRRDRTWSYWALHPHPFQEAVSGRWDQWAIEAPGRSVACAAPGLRYESIRADALYELALGRLRSNPHIELRLGRAADAVEEDGAVLVRTADGVVRAGLAFDTRPPPGIGAHGLAQAFLGQEVETERPVFDSGTATLMDFRCTQAGGTHFTYVLPLSDRRALVEDTWFAPGSLRPPCHRRAIREHLAARGAGGFTVLFEERGVLPMDPVFQPRPGARLLPLGTAGGATRPSTGYAFNAIQARCDEVVADLGAGRMPRPARPRPGLVRFMDHVLLHMLGRRPELGLHVFSTLFAGCPPQALVRFLNDVPTVADLAAVSLAIPFWPVMGAAGQLLAGRIEWPRPAAAG